MDSLVTLHLKCPNCEQSLMDHEKLIDSEPSIRLIFQIGNLRDVIRLSSLYGSYNYETSLTVKEGDIASFFCPQCKTEIKSKHVCQTCGTDMVPLVLKTGGKLSFCPKSGCKDHKIEFDDPSMALRIFYRHFGFRGRDYPSDLDLRVTVAEPVKKVDKYEEIIKTGAFLQTYCPHCHKSLIDGNMLKIKIIGSEVGELKLSPYLNVYTLESTIGLPENEPIADMVCPYCETSFIEEDKDCDLCHSDVARFCVTARTKVIDFYVCSKKGCKWHGLSDEDLDNIRLEDSAEW